LWQYARNSAQRELEDFLVSLRPVLPSVPHAEIVAGDPATEILERAASGNYDLVAIGTHGRTGLPRLLIGSIAEKVVRAAPCPVLTVHESAHG
jgi:nucleotide-binding universal stress UspA family protein